MQAQQNKINFIVWSPDYTDQYGGIIVLHKLADELARLGEHSYIIASKTSNSSKAKTIDLATAKTMAHRDDTYIFYPETVSGNPLGFKNVIRFVLYIPGKNGGDSIYYKSEIIFAHTKYCVSGTPYENAPLLHCIDPKLDIFFDAKKPKSDTCTLIKKGRHKNIYKAPNIIDAYMGSSNLDQVLFNIFNKYETFINYDSASYHSIQAALCGCTSIVIPDEGLSKEEWIRRQPIMKYGIAYGEQDIDWAIKTKHLVREHVQSYYAETLKTVEQCRDIIYQHWTESYSKNNILET
jgi:hypothetical protein